MLSLINFMIEPFPNSGMVPVEDTRLRRNPGMILTIASGNTAPFRPQIPRNIIFTPVKFSARKKNSPLNTATSIGVVEASEALTGGLNPEDMLILQDDRREFRQKMSGVLSDFEFKVTTMYMDGMSCAEICEATGKSAKSVDNALQRSKRKLQEVLR